MRTRIIRKFNDSKGLNVLVASRKLIGISYNF